jgi:hypothetical protein
MPRRLSSRPLYGGCSGAYRKSKKPGEKEIDEHWNVLRWDGAFGYYGFSYALWG